MYPPRSAQYASLPTDPSSENDLVQYPYHPSSSPSLRMRLGSLRRRKFLRPVAIASSILLLLFLFKQLHTSQAHNLTDSTPASDEDGPVQWEKGDFTFADTPRPAYLDIPTAKPLVIRLAIVSRVDDFETRQVLRETMLSGIPKGDVKLDYRFFIGRLKPGDLRATWRMWWDLAWERWYHWDVVTLWDMNDVKGRLSEKRYRALQWTNAVPPDRYDYSMTLDSDAFCLFPVLARRLAYTHPSLIPSKQPILIGRMGTHLVYFENTVPDGNEDDTEEDYHVKGPWYQFPIGFGYMLSSNLTRTLLSADPPLPHHVNFPSDDVMIGAWISGLKLMHDPSAEFFSVLPPPSSSSRSSSHPHSPKTPNRNTYRNATYAIPGTRVHPTPYLPYQVNTTIIDDPKGWHDFRGRGGGGAPVGWESVCVHRMNLREMREFKAMKSVSGAWGG